jgi:hypothetical protein
MIRIDSARRAGRGTLAFGLESLVLIFALVGCAAQTESEPSPNVRTETAETDTTPAAPDAGPTSTSASSGGGYEDNTKDTWAPNGGPAVNTCPPSCSHKAKQQ